MGKITKPKDKFFNYNSMNTRLLTIVMLTLMLGISACVDVDITTPHGPKGPKGPDGASDYDLWKQEVEAGRIEWDKEELALTDFFKFLKGNDGQDGTNGTDGKDGKSAYELWKEKVLSEEGVENPHNKGNKWSKDETSVPDFWRYLTGGTGEVGQVPQIKEDENGVPYWYVGDDKIRKATGEDGDPGDNAVPPTISIIDGFWAVDGVKTDKTATPTDGTNGKPGKTPTVDINPTTGNWILNGEETNTSAKGQDGHTPVVTIDPKTGEWKIDGNPTGKTAFGQKGLKGDDGKDGKSAYELWKEEVEKGTLKDPHSDDPNTPWPTEANTPQDFWDYLVGGESYKVEHIIMTYGYYKDLDPVWLYDGAAYFNVVNAQGETVRGAKVTNISPVEPNKEYTAHSTDISYSFDKTKDPVIVVRPAQLPDNQPVEARTMRPKIKIPGKAKTYTSTSTVVVPNKILLRMKMIEFMPSVLPNEHPRFNRALVGAANFSPSEIVSYVEIERCVDGKWGLWDTPNHNGFDSKGRSFRIRTKQTPTVELVMSDQAVEIKGKRAGNEKNRRRINSARSKKLPDYIIKAHESGTPEQKAVLERLGIWDERNQDGNSYIVLAYGDNLGEDEPQYNEGAIDFGAFCVLPELIEDPALNLAPGLNTSKIYIDKNNAEGAVIWGEVDYTSDPGDYYVTPNTTRGFAKEKFTKHEEGGVTIWKPTTQTRKYTDLKNSPMIITFSKGEMKADGKFDYKLPHLSVYTAHEKTKGGIYNTEAGAFSHMKNFYVRGFEDGMYVSTNYGIYLEDFFDIRAEGSYYGTIRYKLKHDTATDKWYLVNFWNQSEQWEIKEKEWPGEDYYKGKIDEDKQPYPDTAATPAP